MKKAVGYIRVSTEKQAAEGVSLAAQVERIERYCQYAGLELAGVVEDAGISGGKNRSRAGFVELLDRVEAGGVDTLVVYRLDRLSRHMLSLLVFEQFLNENGVELHTVEGQVNTATPDGWLGFVMNATIGEMERRNASARTRSAAQYKRSRGEVVGAVPYGFQRDGAILEPVEAEQAVIRKAARLYARGRTLADICRTFEKQGIKTRTGRKFTPQQVKNLLPEYRQKWVKYKPRERKNQAARSYLLQTA